jgi:uncharacterized protein (DUF1501 family)
MAATTQKDPVLVVVQLSGGNDYLNTVIPYNNPLYRDNRPAVGIADDKIIHLDNDYGIPDYMAPMKKFWDDKKLAVLHGVGFKDSPRSHFRAMDIWHTCEPVKVGTEGWLGRVARDPRILEPLTAIYGDGACLFKDKLIFKSPGTSGYKLHQDYISWTSFPTSFVTVIVAIDPADRESGATEVFAGYHQRGCLSPRDGQYHQLACCEPNRRRFRFSADDH